MKKGDVDIPQHKPGNEAENSMGGTELETMELFKRLPDEYKDYFQFVISRKYELEKSREVIGSMTCHSILHIRFLLRIMVSICLRKWFLSVIGNKMSSIDF
jgi:hypothetical protein